METGAHRRKKLDDNRITLAFLKNEVAAFVDERDWWQFHSPKNLAMSIAIESGELMEHFQWLTPEESIRATQRGPMRKEIEEEVADIMIYCASLANVVGMDLSTAVMRKLSKNRRKYPKEKYRGRF